MSAHIRMARRLDEEKAAMDTCVLDVTFSLGCELLTQVGRMLVLDVFDNGVPTMDVISFDFQDQYYFGNGMKYHLSLFT